MIGSWDIRKLSESQRFFAFSDAYLQASFGTCLRMVDHKVLLAWPNASVALMLAAHSVELFLKGAILLKSSGEIRGHDIDSLHKTYRHLFPDERFAFNCPFRMTYVAMTEDQIEAAKKLAPSPSVLFRYPVDKPGVEWRGVHAFELDEFLVELDQLNGDYARLLVEFEVA